MSKPLRLILCLIVFWGATACEMKQTSPVTSPLLLPQSRVAAYYRQPAHDRHTATATVETAQPVVLLTSDGIASAADADCLLTDESLVRALALSVDRHNATIIPAGVTLHVVPSSTTIEDGIVLLAHPVNYLVVVTDDGHSGAICRAQAINLRPIR